MPMITVRHVTTYRYRQPVAFGEHRLMLRPRESFDQRLLGWKLIITPEPSDLRWAHDVFGNCVGYARFSRRANLLSFDSSFVMDHTPQNTLEFRMEPYAETWPFAYSADDIPDLSRRIERHLPDPEREVDRWASAFAHGEATSTRDMLAAITHAIHANFAYVRREESGIQTPVETLRRRSGSCRDFALLMMEAVRSLGLAARFASGYLHTSGRERRVGGGATHAWCEVFLPGAGWVGFDPTNGIVGNRDLIRVAVARDPKQAVPLSGSFTGFPQDALGMEVEVTVSETTDFENRHPVLVEPRRA